MGLMRFFRSVVGTEEPTLYVEGVLVADPTRISSEGNGGRTVGFHLDTYPDVVFQQELSALAPERRRGDRVRVHYRMAGDVAEVQWVESM